MRGPVTQQSFTSTGSSQPFRSVRSPGQVSPVTCSGRSGQPGQPFRSVRSSGQVTIQVGQVSPVIEPGPETQKRLPVAKPA